MKVLGDLCHLFYGTRDFALELYICATNTFYACYVMIDIIGQCFYSVDALDSDMIS